MASTRTHTSVVQLNHIKIYARCRFGVLPESLTSFGHTNHASFSADFHTLGTCTRPSTPGTHFPPEFMHRKAETITIGKFSYLLESRPVVVIVVTRVEEWSWFSRPWTSALD